jgi:hypothetical protein
LPSRRAIAARLAALPCVRSSTQKPLVGGPIVEKMVKYDSELRKRKQHVQRQPAHRGGGVELLGNRDERHIVLVEQFDKLGKIRQRAGRHVPLLDFRRRRRTDLCLRVLIAGHQAEAVPVDEGDRRLLRALRPARCRTDST